MDATPRYPEPPELSPAEAARRRAATRRLGRIIAALCLLLAAAAAAVMLTLDPGDDGASGPRGIISPVGHERASPGSGL